MTYRIVLGNPDGDKCKVVSRDTLNEALHWLGDNWPLNIHDSAAAVWVELDNDQHLRILAIAQEGVVDSKEVRKAVRLMTTAIDAAFAP